MVVWYQEVIHSISKSSLSQRKTLVERIVDELIPIEATDDHPSPNGNRDIAELEMLNLYVLSVKSLFKDG